MQGQSVAFTVRCLTGIVLMGSTWLTAQDFSVLRINEVIPDHETTGLVGSATSRNMVELYNPGDTPLVIAGPIFSERLALSDSATQPILGLWTFPAGTAVPARGFLVGFLDSDPEIHCPPEASWGLAPDGSEPITLWGKPGADGKRPILDQVWLPPLRAGVSFGRHPDGAGPAPVPIDDTFRYFGFQSPTFGECRGDCATFDRSCAGAPNTPPENLAPTVSLEDHSTNHPAAGEALEIIASVRDDKIPFPPNLARVFIRFRVNGGTDMEAGMTLASGVLDGANEGKPLDRWTLWRGEIPGQHSLEIVEFTIHVEDAEGLTSQVPEVICPEGTGPCNEIGVPGPGCKTKPWPRERFFQVCEVPFRYVSGYEPMEPLRNLVINEVVASQDILEDPDDHEFDDYFEICNASEEVVDLSGLWLSNQPFGPQAWQFPPGSSIGPGQILVVWADGDGGLCPRPDQQFFGDGQECPDPSVSSGMEYHTSFRLDESGDELYLFDRAENGFGVIHGVEFGPLPTNAAFVLVPRCDPNGTFVLMPEPTFRRGNTDAHPTIDLTDAVFILIHLFLGGADPACPDAADVDDNGRIELTDAVFLLQHLFQGGEGPPPPGTALAGIDPTPDALSPCVAPPGP